MKNFLTSVVLSGFLVCSVGMPVAFAQVKVTSPVASVAPSVSPAPTQSPSAVQVSAQQTSPADFLGQVLEAIKKMGGLSTLGKVSALILLICASMKVSFLNPVWRFLGPFQSVAGAGLGLLAGVMGLFGHGAPVTLASLFAYLGAGVGATGLHELLDDIKAIPSLGAGYVSVINLVQKLLKGPPTQTVAEAVGKDVPKI